MKEAILIDNSKLTPTMKIVRCGKTQLFREHNPNDRSFISEENCDLILRHQNKAMYAKLIDNQWYWVNGCGPCNGEERSWKTYIECEKHDVCRECSISRKEIKEAVHGGSNGWLCPNCMQLKKDERRREAFEKFNSDNLSQSDFNSTDEILCPHCGSPTGDEGIHESQDIECHVCEGEIHLTVEFIPYYTTTIKGKRVKS